MRGPPQRIRQTFLAVFNLDAVRKELSQLAEQAALQDTDDKHEVDELAVDERLAYKQKVTKWIGATLENLNSFMFWYILYVSNAARGPLTAFFAKVCKDGAEGVSKAAGAASECPIVKLVCQRVPEIRAMFIHLLSDSHGWLSECWSRAEDAVSQSGMPQPDVSASDVASIESIAFKLALHNYTAFERRIAQPLSRLLDLGLCIPNMLACPKANATG